MRSITIFFVALTLLCGFFTLDMHGQSLDLALNHRTIEVTYLKSSEGGYTILESWVQITNTSLSDEIVLGTIYVLHKDGLNGQITKWHELEGTTLPPLGSTAFSVVETGAPPLLVTGPRGAMVAVVTCTGPANVVRLSGNATNYDASGNVLGVRSLQPF
jgi:hypothetical protein